MTSDIHCPKLCLKVSPHPSPPPLSRQLVQRTKQFFIQFLSSFSFFSLEEPLSFCSRECTFALFCSNLLYNLLNSDFCYSQSSMRKNGSIVPGHSTNLIFGCPNQREKKNFLITLLDSPNSILFILIVPAAT